MSTNERDWFSPRDERREEEPPPPPPPPSQEPPPGLGSHSGPSGHGRHSGHGTGPGQEPSAWVGSWDEDPPGAETAPVPRLPSGGALPGLGAHHGAHHGGRHGRATPPPGHDALEAQPSESQDVLGWPDATPQEVPEWPSAPRNAPEWPGSPQGASEPTAPRRAPEWHRPPHGASEPTAPPKAAEWPGSQQGASDPTAPQKAAEWPGPQHGASDPTAPQKAPEWLSAPRGTSEPTAPHRAPERPHGAHEAHGAHGTPEPPPAAQGPRHASGQGRHGAPGRARHALTDQQVWPPAPREPVGGATQPLPAVEGPLPFEPQQSASPSGPPTPFPRHSGAAPSEPPHSGADPYGPPHPADGPYGTSHAEGPLEPNPVEGPSEGPRATAPKARRKRTLLIAAGAVIVSLLTTAAQTYDGYLFFEKSNATETKEIIVPAGQAGTVHNVEYRAVVTPAKPPANSKHGPEVTWLKVDITKKVLDESSATMTAKPYGVHFEDASGRTWTVEISDAQDPPTDRMEVGREYKIQGLGIVPTPVANEVELSFRPSNYRSDTPTEDLFNREKVAKMDQDLEVLRFRRR
ncbi:hypothetical protein [Nonomuraea sp. NPDC050786]|uniref:hypothetical protein n=1 Tax=Nonomuraea sp. NPDC050786 TaxID=3154840 RepID=UPI0033C83C1E